MKNYRLIRSMIDEAFAGMPMSAENLALRDEMMANAQDRYEDAIAQGKSETEAAAEVMTSLGDVRGLLEQMNAREIEQSAAGEEQQDAPAAATENKTQAGAENPADNSEKPESGAAQGELSGALNKAFDALGDLGRAFVPQTKKIMREVDKATGGVVRDIGRAVNKGMRDAQKAAGDVIDRMSDTGELVFDFGGRKDAPAKAAKTPAELREEAGDLRAQAEIKQAVDDQEGARQLRAQAYALETQADAIEQAEAMQAAQAEAAGQQTAQEFEQAVSDMEKTQTQQAQDAFTRVVDDIAGEAEEAARDADYTVHGDEEKVTGHESYSPAGLHNIDVQCEAVNVVIEPSQTGMIDVVWRVKGGAGPQVRMDGHKLIVRRRSADAIKSLLSIFQRDGGEITIYVPRGYAAGYKISTSSGDVTVRGVDADKVKANTTSGNVCIETDAAVSAEVIDVQTVSGSVTVSACAGKIKTESVSGRTFISCDAADVDIGSVSGAVHVEGACEKCEVDCVSGAVELLFTVVPGKKVDISTVSGSARVALPGDVRGFVAELHSVMGSGDGRIVNEFGPNRFGTCALPVKMDTVSGKLMITRL